MKIAQSKITFEYDDGTGKTELMQLSVDTPHDRRWLLGYLRRFVFKNFGKRVSNDWIKKNMSIRSMTQKDLEVAAVDPNRIAVAKAIAKRFFEDLLEETNEYVRNSQQRNQETPPVSDSNGADQDTRSAELPVRDMRD